MGNRLKVYFDQAAELGGIHAQVKLAMLTKMSANDALKAEDSEENITLFEESYAKVKMFFDARR